MLLKTLELQGFKTFPDKTVLTFHDGITAVVGPNGSGKSNISDAVRWVLGEQSARVLRCTKMEDVIFNGTPTRKPLGFAEVTLSFDNTVRLLPCDDDSVSVTRRYYRSGESEYRINGKSVRLRDINELFMDTGLGRDGYSIIGQGKIDSIVSARSEDRREIFEEAAGISRFRYRREDAQRHLDQAEENLLRLRDILSELEGRIGPLKEQSEKAKKYLALAEEKKKLEIGLWLDTLDSSGKTLREEEDRILTVKSQYDAAEQSIQEMDARLEAMFQKTNGCAAKIDELHRKKAELEESAAKKDGEISVLQNDIRHNGEDIARIEREMEQNRLSDGEMDRQIAESEKQIQEKKKYISNADAALKENEQALTGLRKEMDAVSVQADQWNLKITELTAQATESKVSETASVSSISEINLRLETVKKSFADKTKQEADLENRVKQGAQALQKREEEQNALQNAVKGYELRLETKRAHRETARKQSEKLRLDAGEQLRRVRLLEDLERNMEGFSQSVKAVMREASHGVLTGIHGPVSRLIHVPEAYAVAVETALGGAMQNIVVGDEEDAKRAIRLLKQRRSGRATFLPLTTIRGRQLEVRGLSDCAGMIGIAAELCSCGPQYKEILNSLLGRIAVCEDLDAAVLIARKYGYRFRIVTLDGQVVNTGGSLTGGSAGRNSGLLSRAAEIEKIKKLAAAAQEKSEQAEASLKAFDEEVSSAEAELSGANGELASAREDRVHAEAEQNRLLAERETVQKDAADLAAEEKKAEERLETLNQALETARENSREIGEGLSKLREKLAGLGGSRTDLSRRCGDLEEKNRKLEMDRLSAQKDEQSLAASEAEIRSRKLGHREKQEELRHEIESVRAASVQLQEQIGQCRGEAQKMRDEAGHAAEEAERVSQQRMELEKESVSMRASERDKTDEKEKTSHELARLEERKDALQKQYDEIIARLWEEYELTRREAEEQVGGVIKDVPEAKRRLSELKNSIRDLGTVNVSAVEEYKEVSERYEYLKAQIDDVETSRAELEHMIGNLTHQMKDLFTERFDKIAKNFVQTFRDLFGGGTAALTLSDPDDVLNSGIEISVQPPGKIVAHLESLSGGEKALVAIALYFAIMKVNPPPFCVLDEIEAALDDVNVDRFAAYLRKMTRNTQFIVITHRRGSMEEADVLYGVTMQDEGVSKLLEMPASEVEKKMGMKPS